MESRSEMILTAKTEELEENLSQPHLVFQKCRLTDPGTNPILGGERLATNRLTDSTAYL
jgi:hypothetical protein